ncbi:MAG: hydrogenase formation protein HypD [Candidatus Eiseniibacteriota bacterium]|nr:MAG: hydrogenase formation protein HypD [Candidatus Eisenbacteria bacterium]
MSRLTERFENPGDARLLLDRIADLARSSGRDRVQLMEVCGTHTVAIFRYGIRQLIPENIRLLSGPGCPVCVTPNSAIDEFIEMSKRPGVIAAVFGDMMRVPGSVTSLERAKAKGADVRVVYSSLDALKMAKENPEKSVVFFAVGFETTAPTIAATILGADRDGTQNFFVLPANKLIPPAVAAVLETEGLALDGLICPGHVSTIIGSDAYEFIPSRYGVAAVVAGFQSTDILRAIQLLLEQVVAGKPRVHTEYSRLVKKEGNPAALKVMYDVFEPCDSAWRGLGVIPSSGLKLRPDFSRFDSSERFDVSVAQSQEPAGCLCGEILRGKVDPPDCPLFAGECTPETPVGACMVTTEGTCQAHYRFRESRD